MTTHIRDRYGRELYKIYQNQNRTLIKLEEIPLQVRQAVLAIEDKDFYNHHGFSLSGFIRSTFKNSSCLFHPDNCSIQGGSTITQQLVKTTLLTPERTIRRKLRELVLSVAVESIYSKDQILEMYLNQVPYGGTTYGIEEAAQTYFGKSVKDLDLSEAAILAGLPASPTTYSPWGTHPELAKARQEEVLNQMVNAGFIDWNTASAASSKDIVFLPPDINIKAPHFVMYVKEILAQKYGSALVEYGGLDVTTTLDLDLQEQAQKIVADEINKVSRMHISNGAGLITRPKTGEILAMVGSKDYFDIKNDGNVNITLSPRQPGSSIKPINYSLAFMLGFTPSSLIEDTPITYRTAGQPNYSPVNYDRRFHGKVTLRTALASSYNVPAVKLLAANGVKNMINLAKNMGINTWEDTNRFGLSLTLGGGEVKMTELAVAYGVFSNGGYKVDLNPILEVKNHNGDTLEKYTCPQSQSLPQFKSPLTRMFSAKASYSMFTKTIPCSEIQVLDAKVAFLISDILSDNQARSPTFGTNSQLYIPGNKVAVKTGTTNSLRDNWTIGYTSDFLVATWVGNNDNTPMSYVASGVTGASPIWRKLTDTMLKTWPSAGFNVPSDLVKVNICQSTGQLGCTSCPGRPEYFIPGTQPKTACGQLPANADSNSKNQAVKPEKNGRGRILEGTWTVR